MLTLNFNGDPDRPTLVGFFTYQMLKSMGILWEIFPDAPEHYHGTEPRQTQFSGGHAPWNRDALSRQS